MEIAKASTRNSRASSFRRSDFDLALTLASGQVFRWRQGLSPQGTVPVFTGWINGSLTRVSQREDRLLVQGSSEVSARNFFSLDVDLPALTQAIGVDPVIQEALRRYPGLRVIRQDPWECTVSFMLSAYNNIPRLTGMIETLAHRFGKKADGVRPFFDKKGLTPFGFPRPEVLANVSERTLRQCGLGYRAPYLKAMSQAVASARIDLDRLRALEDEELRRALLTLPGIGEKVVECVMLFAYGRGAAFPVDVWIGRAMRGWYFRRRKVSDKKIREFARKHFGPYCGWAQQYLYCLARQMPC